MLKLYTDVMPGLRSQWLYSVSVRAAFFASFAFSLYLISVSSYISSWIEFFCIAVVQVLQLLGLIIIQKHMHFDVNACLSGKKRTTHGCHTLAIAVYSVQ